MRASYRRPIIRRYTTASYKPTFTQSTERAWHQKLTPLSWLLMGVSGVMLVGMISVGITKIGAAHNGTQSLSDYLGTSAHPAVVAAPAVAEAPASVSQTALQAAPAVAKPAEAAPVVRQPAPQAPALPTIAPTVVPAPVVAPVVAQAAAPTVSGAPWAAALVKQADGTLVAPPEVLQRASADVQAWFQATRTFDAKSYLKSQDAVLEQYLTGSALETIRQQTATQKQFAINRDGRIAIEIKGFSADGFTAQAGVVTRGWVNDLYIAKTGKLAKKNVAQTDQLTIMTIRYDTASNRWKIASIDDVAPLK